MRLDYSLVIESTHDPTFWSWFSPDLPGYTGNAESRDEAISRAIDGIGEYIDFLREVGTPVPPRNPHAAISFLEPGDSEPKAKVTAGRHE